MAHTLGKAFTDFLKYEVEPFEIIRDGQFAFDAKQRMLERAESYAIIEAYRIPFIMLWRPPLKKYITIIKKAEIQQAQAREREMLAPSHPERAPHTIKRHREELKMALCTFTIHHLENRRLETMSAIASWAALLAAIVAIAISLLQ